MPAAAYRWLLPLAPPLAQPPPVPLLAAAASGAGALRPQVGPIPCILQIRFHDEQLLGLQQRQNNNARPVGGGSLLGASSACSVVFRWRRSSCKKLSLYVDQVSQKLAHRCPTHHFSAEINLAGGRAAGLTGSERPPRPGAARFIEYPDEEATEGAASHRKEAVSRAQHAQHSRASGLQTRLVASPGRKKTIIDRNVPYATASVPYNPSPNLRSSFA